MQLIGRTEHSTILGLLPVELSDQHTILELITTLCDGSFNRLAQFQEDYPAVTSYGIALALSAGTKEANLYNALQDQLGVPFALPRRQELSVAFDVACRALGLVMPDAEEDTQCDRNLRPIIFQAGILHYWVKPLANAVTTYLERNPCPDLEDEHQVARFARLLAERVPVAQARLRRTLESSVGPLVCRAILGAFSSKDFDQLPPHLREPMREAGKKSGGTSIRSPYLRYDPENGRMEVVLPKQSSRLADFSSCWVLGTNSYNALIERTLVVEDMPGVGAQIRLTGLRNKLQDQTFDVKLTPDQLDPFFVFRAEDGRRLQVGMPPAIELPLGDYHLLIPLCCMTNEEDEFVVRGAFKTATVEIFPGRPDLGIHVAGRDAVIRPRLGSDILIRDQAGNKLQSVGGQAIFYGDTMEVQAFTPVVLGGCSETMEYRIDCLDNPSIGPSRVLREATVTSGAYMFHDLSADLVRPFLRRLPAGIYDVQITAEGHSRHFTKRFAYWRGFRRTTKTFGYVCIEAPLNFDATSSIGVRKHEKGLELCEDHHAAEVVVGIKQPTRTFSLVKPGIWLRLTEPDRLEGRAISMGRSIEVASSEQLVVESGDALPWTIRCNETTLAVLKPGQAKHTLHLGAVLGQFGDSCVLEAAHEGAQPQTLISLSKANLARDLAIVCVPGDLFYRAAFRIGRAQVRELELQVVNFADEATVSRTQRIEAAEGVCVITAFASDAATLRFTVDEADWVVTFEANLAAAPPGIYFVDFKARKDGQIRWQPLKVADKHGLSESRLVVSTTPVAPNAGGSWAHLLKRAKERPDIDSSKDSAVGVAGMTTEECKQTLERLQGALLFKYASAVWPAIQWLETALVRVSQNAYADWSQPICTTFAGVAVSSLTRKSDSPLSIHTTLVFGSQELVLAQRGETFAGLGTPDTDVGRTFQELGALARAASLSIYAFQGGAIDRKFFGYFANAPAVSTRRATEFEDFRGQDFFKDLAEGLQVLESRQSDIATDLLLTPEHLLAAVRALNRRFRPLELARNSNQTDAALGRLTSEIQACGNRLDQVSPTVKDLVHFPNYVELSIPIRIAESALVQVVSDLLLTVTGLARLTGHGLLSRTDFVRRLGELLTPEGPSLSRRTHRLCLLMSLAPELFAFYMLFWESTLKPRASHEGH